MRRAARIDKNQPEIVSALRKIGASVELLHSVGRGCPDILVGYRGQNILMEIKTEKGKLNEEQKAWHLAWRGPVFVVRTVEEALKCMTQTATHRT